MVLERAGINPDLVLSGGGSGRGMGSGMGGGMGASGSGMGVAMTPGTERVTYCNIPLPVPEPLVPETETVAERLFIVCQPAAVPERILRDAFSRFGNLIDVYLLSGTVYIVKLQWLKHLWDHGHLFEIWVV